MGTWLRGCDGKSPYRWRISRDPSYLDLCDTERRCWNSGEPENGVMDVDECKEFQRLWSAIQFTMIQTAVVSQYDVVKQ
jgi:cytoplasmic FMR1 interacting protein